MQPRRHRCGEILAYYRFVGEWYHPAWGPPFYARSSGHGAVCPRCGREIYPVDTGAAGREPQAPLFD
jgi:hypothetical protein